ncbi:MAG: helicase-related protein [Chloroflexota bacterium]
MPPTSFEIDAIRAVEDYGEQVLRHAATARVQLRTLAHWTVLHLHKRALSSPEALRCSLRNRRERLKQNLERAVGRVSYPTDRADDTPISPDVSRANVLDEDTGERLDTEEAGRRTERLVYGSPRQIRVELNHLEDVLSKAKRITASRDNKLQRLLGVVLKERLRVDPKVVIFTRYRDTTDYLAERIGSDSRYEDVTVLTIHGGLSERRRREIFSDFERAEVAVLVATDAISEGINLHHAAAQVIHYELPWNPNRLEQRNGRVDRFGQRKPVVTIRTMVMDETLDATILDLMKEHDVRLGPKQLRLFDSAGPSFLDEDVGRVCYPTDEPQDPFDEETLERIKGDSFYGQTHVSLPEIERRLEETAQTVGSPEQVKAFVFSGLDRFGCSVTENGDRNGRLNGSYRIGLTEPALQTACVGDVIERATFDPEWALDDPDLTLLDVGHPLVRRLIEEVKQNAFREGLAERERLAKGERGHYGRTPYVVTPDVGEVTALFHLLARYVVNTDPTSIVEELLPVAVPVYGDLTGVEDL